MTTRLRVRHLASGDLWAGAEVQATTLLRHLARDESLALDAVLFNDARMAAELRGLGIPTTVLDERSLGPLALYRGLVAHFRAYPVDVLHTHKYKDNVLGSLAARRCRVPRVVRTMHGWPEPFRGLRSAKMRLFQALDRWANRHRVDRVIAVSEQIRGALSGYGTGKVVCIHNGIDPGIPGGPGRNGGVDLVIAAVGRLTPVKGYADLLRAMPALISAWPERGVRLVLIGDGPLSGALRRQAEELGIAERVEMAGHLDDCLERVARVDAVAFPSLSEGIPMALLEALALERPVVATRVGGIPEVIRDGENGLLVEPGDVDALTAALRRVLGEAEFAARLGRAGGATVRERFSAERNAALTARVYRDD